MISVDEFLAQTLGLSVGMFHAVAFFSALALLVSVAAVIACRPLIFLFPLAVLFYLPLWALTSMFSREPYGKLLTRVVTDPFGLCWSTRWSDLAKEPDPDVYQKFLHH